MGAIKMSQAGRTFGYWPRQWALVAVWILFVSGGLFAQHYPVLLVPNSPHDIFALMQDSQSRMWLGTNDDVYAFDGARFYSLRPYGFPQESPASMAADTEGGIWIATQGSDMNGGNGRG